MGLCYDTTGQGDFTAECNILSSVWVAGSTPTVIPVPAAVWLFGTGLPGLAGIARRGTGRGQRPAAPRTKRLPRQPLFLIPLTARGRLSSAAWRKTL